MELMERAAQIASRRPIGDKRRYQIAAVGVTPEGRIYHARNLAYHFSECDQFIFRPEPSAHAEFKLSRALTKGSIVYVARVLRNGDLALAKPCPMCMIALRSKQVKRVIYSIDNNTYGTVEP